MLNIQLEAGQQTPEIKYKIYLQNFISLNHVKVIASLSPTYWPSHRNRHPDTLEFFINNLPNRFTTEIINLNDPASDHTPVLLQIGAHPSLKKNRSTITPGITNWNKFKDLISKKQNYS
jgi:hypothetical protein